ncbi:hypothetical protein COW36_12765 [bacterium (Candidatus Blackallbacteria) CG17_big_fil_post_rev_8_21_14_2_50_48_46]|uniref:LIM zinc-binding domain-containing protein n=1 Tax=bacterium (Candidatus Blackallbacteria) CG17_big_fil_post_rev_8_21_14_2_50_48_46 TaxID=2014261 RepID=A0A2M7G453_9BACT|nr:MAG: hypothetical protein COW64_02500 [bacterium (Candidatus Blackallbacteria) CG18_big_fil_WC_8_21_14_2_50_49_26]PIW16633.1 MAG: hypothetical protein COW36_12765 [bacterium (Candidatus Blackallbacteria) CG17_big_fil_post_rev_8_21_14_2_50_48_46]PIW46140.1 MAG: hypothetical protein COW20_18025 [bacterium (Candidatus Blackallbacteria) CG13_big_fil_rev_8_21_14_2_50_49_14]
MPMPPNLCTRCGKRLGPQAIRAAGKQFHPPCYICDSCKKPLEKTFVPRGDKLYHPACHEKLFVPKCTACGQAIQGTYHKDAQGRYHPECYQKLHNLVCSLCQQAIEGPYLQDSWGQKAHPEHPEGPTGQCNVCARLIYASAAGGTHILGDGRLLCAGCHAEQVEGFAATQAAKLAVIAQMHAVGFDYIPDYIQVKRYEDQQLINQRMRASATGNIHGYTRTAQRNIPGYGLILEHSIHILEGLPKVAFMGVLAHELLHVWVNERPLSHLSHEEVEGFCNLGSALICQNALQQEDSALARVLLERMQTDPDPAYGEGYRAMAWRLNKLGWPALLAALQNPEQRLEAPPAEVLKPQIKAAPTPPAPRSVEAERNAKTAEKLAELKARLAQTPASSRPEASAQTPPPPRPEVAPEIAEKIRERFAQRRPEPPKPGGNKPGGSKLGKMKKPGKR